MNPLPIGTVIYWHNGTQTRFAPIVKVLRGADGITYVTRRLSMPLTYVHESRVTNTAPGRTPAWPRQETI